MTIATSTYPDPTQLTRLWATMKRTRPDDVERLRPQWCAATADAICAELWCQPWQLVLRYTDSYLVRDWRTLALRAQSKRLGYRMQGIGHRLVGDDRINQAVCR